jgi:DNA-directed RNA polymerase specialized sigma24 family protein
MDPSSSVTTWVGLLAQGDQQAAQRLWERYFARLVELARGQLVGARKQVADEEDVALSAFHTFCQAVNRERIPQLGSRDDLWRTLVLITAGKAVDQRRRQLAKKRGADKDQQDDALLEEVIGSEPNPAFAAQVADDFQRLLALLPDEGLRTLALAKLEGHSNEEIAEQMECSLRTVTRRLLVIRRTWEDAANES